MKVSPGFTLVEMAVVLFIIGILIGSLLVPFSVQMNQSRVKATEQRLEYIKEALIGFAIVNGRLPCPALSDDDDGGTEDSGLCGGEGFLPWATLALDVGENDAWGSLFRYRVDSQYTTQPFPEPPNTSDKLKIRDRQNNHLTQEGVNSNVLAIIFSYGKDGQPNGENKITANKIYTQDMYIENQFDDILIWLPKNILINRLAVAGKWPPS